MLDKIQYRLCPLIALCGGYYSSFEDPTQSEFYAPECSLGTQEFFYREIKARKISPERDKVIEECIKSEKI